MTNQTTRRRSIGGDMRKPGGEGRAPATRTKLQGRRALGKPSPAGMAVRCVSASCASQVASRLTMVRCQG
jgi:hypothetical protein